MSLSTRGGLVLGGGGVLGAAWMVGALDALTETEGVDPRNFDLIVGTSAGALLAALLGSGVSLPALLAHQREGGAGDALPIDYDYERDSGGPLPPRPRLRVGSKRLLLTAARQPLAVKPRVAITAVFPEGRGSLQQVRSAVEQVTPAGRWCEHPGIVLTALDWDAGRRVLFRGDASGGGIAADGPGIAGDGPGIAGDGPGIAGDGPGIGADRGGVAPELRVGLSDAVVASCAIPGWFAPLVLDGRRYVDGGAWSVSNADVAAGQGLDELYVLAPMASFELDRPRPAVARLERLWRRTNARRLAREVRPIRAAGTRVKLLTPGPEDLRAMGPNVMDASRRQDVLDVSLRTSRRALRDARAQSPRGG